MIKTMYQCRCGELYNEKPIICIACGNRECETISGVGGIFTKATFERKHFWNKWKRKEKNHESN